MKVSFKLTKTNRIADIAGSIRERASRVVRDTVFAVEADTKARAPVRKVLGGTLRRSYQGRMEDDLHGVVGTNVEYAIYVEFGTRRQVAKPHLTPALDAARPRFRREMKELFDE